jgi:hypothetical protein
MKFLKQLFKEILNLLFEERKQVITFEEIKEIFLNSNEKTKEFYDKFRGIKKNILLFNLGRFLFNIQSV